ncbi:hypothetical protein I4U23_024513 [Adineta vaga]|nr:hypothetical protein I4U23_024513 [Adineta vaga]
MLILYDHSIDIKKKRIYHKNKTFLCEKITSFFDLSAHTSFFFHVLCVITKNDESQVPDLNDAIQKTSIASTEFYNKSVCGSILCPSPSNSTSDIFSYLRHAKFDAFRRSIDIFHKEIIQMKNEHDQTILHVLTIHAFPYQWVRLSLMRECDPCQQDNDGYTAAHYAVERDDVEMLKALTTRFSAQIQPFPVEQTIAIHESCLKALSIREKHGLTVFMLACQHESLRCINYLLELNINDAHLKDHFGDTCLHYAVARRNEILVEKLVNQCNADVNAGERNRPNALDLVQFNREQQKAFDRLKDDAIEQILLANHAVNHCQIRRTTTKRKRSCDQSESVVANLACLTVNSSIMSRIDTAKNYARIAFTYETNGDLPNAQHFYERAMNCVPNDILDWADYSYHIAKIHLARGENQLALSLLQQSLILRKRYEEESEEIDNLQHAINNIQSASSIV